MSRNIKILKEKHHNDTFIILSAGVGRRMKSSLPKSLLSYNGKRIIDYQAEAIKRQSLTADIIVVGGFKFDLMLKLEHRLVENILFETTNICESLRLGINSSLKSNIYIIHGDIIFHRDAINVPDKNIPYVIIDSTNSISSKEVGVLHQNGKVLNLAYGLEDKWCQIAYIPAEYYNLIKTKINQVNKSWSTYEFINLLLDFIPFEIHINKKPILEIDSSTQL